MENTPFSHAEKDFSDIDKSRTEAGRNLGVIEGDDMFSKESHQLFEALDKGEHAKLHEKRNKLRTELTAIEKDIQEAKEQFDAMKAADDAKQQVKKTKKEREALKKEIAKLRDRTKTLRVEVGKKSPAKNKKKTPIEDTPETKRFRYIPDKIKDDLEEMRALVVDMRKKLESDRPGIRDLLLSSDLEKYQEALEEVLDTDTRAGLDEIKKIHEQIEKDLPDLINKVSKELGISQKELLNGAEKILDAEDVVSTPDPLDPSENAADAKEPSPAPLTEAEKQRILEQMQADLEALKGGSTAYKKRIEFWDREIYEGSEDSPRMVDFPIMGDGFDFQVDRATSQFVYDFRKTGMNVKDYKKESFGVEGAEQVFVTELHKQETDAGGTYQFDILYWEDDADTLKEDDAYVLHVAMPYAVDVPVTYGGGKHTQTHAEKITDVLITATLPGEKKDEKVLDMEIPALDNATNAKKKIIDAIQHGAGFVHRKINAADYMSSSQQERPGQSPEAEPTPEMHVGDTMYLPLGNNKYVAAEVTSVYENGRLDIKKVDQNAPWPTLRELQKEGVTQLRWESDAMQIVAKGVTTELPEGAVVEGDDTAGTVDAEPEPEEKPAEPSTDAEPTEDDSVGNVAEEKEEEREPTHFSYWERKDKKRNVTSHFFPRAYYDRGTGKIHSENEIVREGERTTELFDLSIEGMQDFYVREKYRDDKGHAYLEIYHFPSADSTNLKDAWRIDVDVSYPPVEGEDAQALTWKDRFSWDDGEGVIKIRPPQGISSRGKSSRENFQGGAKGLADALQRAKQTLEQVIAQPNEPTKKAVDREHAEPKAWDTFSENDKKKVWGEFRTHALKFAIGDAGVSSYEDALNYFTTHPLVPNDLNDKYGIGEEDFPKVLREWWDTAREIQARGDVIAVEPEKPMEGNLSEEEKEEIRKKLDQFAQIVERLKAAGKKKHQIIRALTNNRNTTAILDRMNVHRADIKKALTDWYDSRNPADGSAISPAEQAALDAIPMEPPIEAGGSPDLTPEQQASVDTVLASQTGDIGAQQDAVLTELQRQQDATTATLDAADAIHAETPLGNLEEIEALVLSLEDQQAVNEMAELAGETAEVADLRANLDRARSEFLAAKKDLARVSGMRSLITSKDRKALAQTMYDEAQQEYTEARDAFVEGSISKLYKEHEMLLNAEIAEQLKLDKSNLGRKIFNGIRGLHDKLGSWNLNKGRLQEEINAQGRVTRMVRGFVSVRTAIYAGLAATGAVGIGLRRTFSGIGTAGMTYDLLQHYAREKEKTDELLQPITAEEIREQGLSIVDIQERLQAIAARSLLDKQEVGSGPHSELHATLMAELDRLEREQSPEERQLSEVLSFLQSVDVSAENDVLKELQKQQKKHKLIAAGAGVAGAFGLPALFDALGVGEKVNYALKYWGEHLGILEKDVPVSIPTPVPEKPGVDAVSGADAKPDTASGAALVEAKETGAVTAAAVEIIREKEGFSHAILRSIDGKDERGIITRFVEAHKGDSNPSLKQLEDLIDKRGGVDKLGGEDLKLVSGLMADVQYDALDENLHTILGVNEGDRWGLQWDSGEGEFALVDMKDGGVATVAESTYTPDKPIGVGTSAAEAVGGAETGKISADALQQLGNPEGGIVVDKTSFESGGTVIVYETKAPGIEKVWRTPDGVVHAQIGGKEATGLVYDGEKETIHIPKNGELHWQITDVDSKSLSFPQNTAGVQLAGNSPNGGLTVKFADGRVMEGMMMGPNNTYVAGPKFEYYSTNPDTAVHKAVATAESAPTEKPAPAEAVPAARAASLPSEESGQLRDDAFDSVQEKLSSLGGYIELLPESPEKVAYGNFQKLIAFKDQYYSGDAVTQYLDEEFAGYGTLRPQADAIVAQLRANQERFTSILLEKVQAGASVAELQKTLADAGLKGGHQLVSGGELLDPRTDAETAASLRTLEDFYLKDPDSGALRNLLEAKDEQEPDFSTPV